MPVTFISIGTVNPDEGEAMQSYATQAPPLLVAAGAKPKMRGRLVEELVGDGAPQTIFIAEFDSAEAAKAALATDEYQALVPDRDKAFSKLNFFLVDEF